MLFYYPHLLQKLGGWVCLGYGSKWVHIKMCNLLVRCGRDIQDTSVDLQTHVGQPKEEREELM